MAERSISGKLEQSAIGVQKFLIIDAAPTGDRGKEGGIAKDAGALAVAGNYDMVVDVSGLSNVEVILRQSAAGGAAVTPQVFTVYADGVTQKTAGATAAAFVTGTRQTIAFTNLKGERKVIVRIPITAGQSVTLDQAEVNGL